MWPASKVKTLGKPALYESGHSHREKLELITDAQGSMMAGSLVHIIVIVSFVYMTSSKTLG